MKLRKCRGRSNRQMLVSALTWVFIVMAGIVGFTYPVYAEQKVYTNEYSDLIATVEDGGENDVYFANVQTPGTSDSDTTIMFVNTEKEVTISMKEGKSVTTDCIYVVNPSQTNGVRHIILDNVSIDRSSEELFFQWVDLVNGLSDEKKAMLSAIYFPGTTMTNEYGGTIYSGKLRLTLKGNNVLKGAKSSNADQSYQELYTPSKDDNHSAIWAMNLGIDGTGSLEAYGTDYGIYSKRVFSVNDGCIKASGSKKDIYCVSSEIRGGCYDQGSSADVYGFPAYAGTVNSGNINLYSIYSNTDESTKEAYPYRVRYTDEASDYLNTFIARYALSNLDNGEDYVNAYDSALAGLDSYYSGNSVSVNYGMNYGFSMSQSMAIVNALKNDHPEYWWLWINSTSAGPAGAAIQLENSYSYAKYLSNTEKFENAVSEVSDSSGVTESMTDYQKAYVLYQALASHVSYDLSYIDQSANSAFVSGKAVCDGYAKAYIYLLRKQGIPASYVEGWGTPGGETGGMHGWVIVKLSDEYYYCDPTWDGMGSTATFNNYMLNASEFAANGHEVFADDMGYALPASTGLSLGAPSDTVTITANTTEDAVIYPNGIKVEKGSPFKIKVVPNVGKTLDAVTVNDTPVTPKEDTDGSFSYIVQASSTDTVINVTCKTGSKVTTKLSAVKDSLTFKVGDTVSGSVKLTDGEGLAVSGKEISFSTVCVSDENIAIADIKETTDENGVATFNLGNLAVGEYRVNAAFAGNDSYRSSDTIITIAVLTDTVYTAGDFVLSRTGGGTLTDGVDYSYTETEVAGSGVLSILSDTPMTISMSENVSFSDDRIYIDADESANISLTFSDVRIDRSKINTSKGDEEEDGFYTSALSSKNSSQNISINLAGENILKGIGYVNNVSKYITVYNGSYTFAGTGSLMVEEDASAARASSQLVDAYGMDCNSVIVKSGNITVNTDGFAKMFSIYGIEADYYKQYGGDVRVTVGKSIADSTSIYRDHALYCSNTFVINKGNLITSNGGSTSLASDGYVNHACIYAFMADFDGGAIEADGDTYGIYVYYCYETKHVYVDKMALSGSQGTLGYQSVGSGSLLIENGLFNIGDVAARTALDIALVEDSTITEEMIDGVKWYRVKASYQPSLEITGGVEGIDYEYNKGEVRLLTETPLVFTMKEGMEASSDKIVSGSDEALTYNVSLKNVKFDRSNITFDDVDWALTDTIIDIAKGDLSLTLLGNNYMQGSVERSFYNGTSRGNNTGILIETGKVTIGGSGSINIIEPYVGYFSAGIYAGEIIINSGTVDVVTGCEGVGLFSVRANTQYNNKSAGNGNITVNGGVLKAVIAGGDSKDSQYNSAGALCAYGKLVINGGEVTASMGDAAGSSYGVLTGGQLVMTKGKLTATSGKAGLFSSAIQSGSDFIISGGEITAIGDCSGFNNYGYGIIVFGDIDASGGKISVTGASGDYGSSIGIYQTSSTDFVKLRGAEIITRGADSPNSSFGAKFNGHTEISAGKITAIGGKAESGDSVGLYNDTDSETVISGGEINLSGSDAANMSLGMFQSSISGGVDLTISGGTIQASGGAVTGSGEYADAESSGIYVYNQLVITGGNIKAEGLNKPIDSNVASIRGGAFAVGNQNEGTVYGYKVADGYKVTDSSEGVYRYIVSSIASGGESGSNGGNSGSGGNSETGNTENGTGKGDNAETGNTGNGNGSDGNTGNGTGNEGNTGGGSEDKTPSVGTTESDTSGKATYKVAETTKDSSGNTVVEVTYVAPTAKEKKATSVTVPDTVTLEDGTKAQVTEIAANAFKKDTKLKKVTVGSNVETIGANAFSGCTNLTTATIKGQSLEKVGDGAFQNCKKLTKVKLSNNVTTIGKNAFSGDKKLKEVTLNGNKIKKVGKNAFKGIKKNAKIIIQAKDSKTYKKVVNMIKKSGAKNVKYTFKKKK